MRLNYSFVLLHLLVLIVPLFEQQRSADQFLEELTFPLDFEGLTLAELPLSEREEGFVKSFPGRIGRFTDGAREILIRIVSRPTRKLHPSADCFKGVGYKINPIPGRIDRAGGTWGCFFALRNGERLRVCERIADRQGKEFYDVSSWFWAAALAETKAPWLAYTVVEEANL